MINVDLYSTFPQNMKDQPNPQYFQWAHIGFPYGPPQLLVFYKYQSRSLYCASLTSSQQTFLNPNFVLAMKPQNLSVDTTAIHECERMMGKRLRRLFQATMAAVDNNSTKNKNSYSIASYTEEFKRLNQIVNTEDSIKTIMFLGSWCHT
ncbi:hypothetical protein R6Q57_017398 [Mikania cordata]